MAPGPVIPTLSAWLEERVSAVYNASTQAEFDEAFDALLAKHAHITVNGKHVSREHYKQLLRVEKKDEVNAKVDFSGAVQVPANSEKPIDAGTVGTFFTAAITTHLKTSTVHASLNVTIIQDEHLKAPEPTPVGEYFDRRKVSVLNEVLIDQPETGIIPGIVTADV